ncbi:MAG: hypothetical protein IK025_08485 [Bacteroidales bacterium]|nr:hypothetical protein [Bacteroidales bacterium]
MNEKFHNKVSRIIFIIIALAIAAIMFSSVSDYGNSTAEDEYQISQAVQLDRYYRSLGKDTSILESTHPMYSGWFNALTVTMSDVFTKFEIRSVRHGMNVVFGFLGIIFAALLAKRCRNWRTGTFVLLLLGFSPVIFGHAMFNLDDIPVFASFAASLYFTKRLADHFPKPKILDAIFFALSTALCITANPDCSLIVAIALILCIIGLIAQRKHDQIKKATIRYSIFAFCSLAVICGIVVLLIPQGIGAWLDSFSPTSPTRILFQGKLYWTDLLPWYYNVKMLVMTIPAAVFVGMLLALGLCFVKKSNRTEIITLLAISVLAILLFSLKSDTNGIWQHLLFAEIPLYIIAAIGFDMLAESSRSTATQIAGIAIPVLLMIMPAVHIFRSHPYSHIYYNEFTGGVQHAFGRYEIENYGVSNREASQWVIDNGKYGLSGNQLFVATRSELAGKYYFGKYKYEVSIVESRWAERANHLWDYAIFPVTGIEPEILTSPYFPPKNTVDTISIDNVPICLVLQRTDTCDLYGRGYLANNDVPHAIELLETAVRNDSTNESAMINLIDANLRINNKDAMKKWIDRFLAIAPRNDVGNYYNAYYHNITGNNTEAERICKEIIDYNPRFSLAYMFLSTIYIQQKQFDLAESTILATVDYDIYDEQAARQLVRVYNAQQKDIRDAELAYYEYAYKSYDKRGKKELAEKFKKLYEESKANRQNPNN